jgi:hypothetical protein
MNIEALKSKMAIWICNGVNLAWLINPNVRNVMIYRPGSDVVSSDANLAVGIGPVAGFVLNLEEVWMSYTMKSK